MSADPHANAVHGRRKALWLIVFAMVVLHTSLGSLGGHAGVLRATCAVLSAATTPPAEAGVRGPNAAGPDTVTHAGPAAREDTAGDTAGDARTRGLASTARSAVTGTETSTETSAGMSAGAGAEAGAGTVRPSRPCQAPHPRRPPCRALAERGPGHQRTAVPWQVAAGPRCPLLMDHGRRLAGPGRACPHERASQAPAPRSGAGLLIDLCASRT